MTRPPPYLVILTFAAAFACYLDRVGFPIVYTALARDAWIPKTIQGSVHSAFYNGYAATQVPGGALATKYGGDRVLKIAFAFWGVFSALTPSDGGKTWAMWTCRFAVGCAMGTVFPSMHSMLARAVPLEERNRAVSFMTSGMYFGSAFAMVVVPMAMEIGGARLATTATGCAAFVWLLVWNAVNEDGKLTRAVAVEEGVLPGATGVRRARGTPWGNLMSSPAVLVIMLNNFTFHYAFFILMSWMPTFYEQKLGLDAGSYTLLKMIPYLVMGTCSNLGGILADKFMGSKQYSRTYVRKALNGVGFTVGAIALWVLPKCSNILSAALVSSFALGALAISRAGYAVNHMDIAPRLAGVLMGMSNGCGAMAGMIGPWLTGLMLDTAPSPWEAAFRTPAYFCVGGALLYARYATAEQLFD